MARNPPKTDENSPYFLHPGENPSLVLVTPLLDNNNYHSWARSMKTALILKNKFDFVDGTIAKPSTTDVIYGQWRRCNNMILSWIIRSLSTSIAQKCYESSNC